MKKTALKYLGCPICSGEFELLIVSKEDDEILEGRLSCQSCKMNYSIVRGIPRLLPPDLDKKVKDTVGSFGFEWNYFSDKIRTLKEDREFLSLIPPVTPLFFKHKVVLDVGCGMGRLARLSASYGAKDVIGIDLSSSVESAFNYTRDLPNVHIIQCDLHAIPLRQKVDFAYSLGVLHHIPDGFEGFMSICRHLIDKGGAVAFWVYGKEGNLLMRALQAPARVLTTRLSHEANLILAQVMTGFLFLCYNVFYVPLNQLFFRGRLYYTDYLCYFHSLSFHDRQSVVFDFLSTPIVKYYSYSDVREWLKKSNLTTVRIQQRNHNSWGVVGAYSPVPNLLEARQVSDDDLK